MNFVVRNDLNLFFPLKKTSSMHMAFSKKMDEQQKYGLLSFNNFHFYYNTEIRFEFHIAGPHLQVTANP